MTTRLKPAHHFVLCSESDRVSQQDLYRLWKPAEEYCRLVNRAWDPGRERPLISTISDRRKRPTGCYLILFVDAAGRSAVQASHYPLLLPTAARVYANVGSGLNSGNASLAEAMTHELAEIPANPYLTEWVEVPGTGGAETPREPADWSQSHFMLDVGDTKWRAANFLHPAAFGLENPPGVEGFDHAGRHTGPFQLERTGYRVMRRGSERWIELGTGERTTLTELGASRQHPLSRTRHLATGEA